MIFHFNKRLNIFIDARGWSEFLPCLFVQCNDVSPPAWDFAILLLIKQFQKHSVCDLNVKCRNCMDKKCRALNLVHHFRELVAFYYKN